MRFIRFYQTIIIITLLVYAYYLYYRIIYTINPDAIIVSILFFGAEFHGFIALFLYFFQMWYPLKRTTPPPPPGMTVDFYIPTYNEDIRLVRETALGCLNVNYPHNVYILDDGDRPEFKRMAEEIGCYYIRRGERSGAKAGNLNNALQLTKGEFIAVFDADYVPQPDFLEKTLGFFEDPKVAFVQTPHQYYNIDSFTFRIKKGGKKGWHEQDVFYRLMMPGRDYWGSTMFVGTGAIIRRKALEDIGGFATETLTEDFHTTLRLYSKKWKGIYQNEILATGLAAQDIKNYHIQKLRWGEGNISLLFKKENPLLLKGLTIPQKIAFFATIFSWTIGFPKIVYFTMPSIMILFEKYPIIHFDAAFLMRYAVFLATVILGVKIV
ncbi:MAG: glycosyltransferase, partial [Nitrospirae bacterium]|nr:glycosyltransferase [Nitrospirota bacterium]